MKNILNDKPQTNLNARLSYSLNLVKDIDIKGKKILDIGCGYGWFEEYALRKNVKKIIGIEITESDLKTVKKYIKDNRANFRIAGGTSLPFRSNSFDTVVCWEVIEHIPKNTEKLMFKEVHRVLKNGGRFYLSTPYRSWQAMFFDPAWWLIGHRHYSRRSLQEFGKAYKLKLVNIYVKGRYWALLAFLNMYFSKWVLRRHPIFEKYFIKKEIKEYKYKNGFMGIFAVYEKKDADNF